MITSTVAWIRQFQYVVLTAQASQKRKITMKSLIWQARYLRSTSSKIVMALTFVSVIGVLSISPAFADHGHGEWRGNYYGYGYRHGYYGHRKWHGDYDDYGYRPRYRQPYIYAQPVYVPPPVYPVPLQSPGITIFFPLNFLRH
jgi:hypothetical protein